MERSRNNVKKRYEKGKGDRTKIFKGQILTSKYGPPTEKINKIIMVVDP